MAFFAATGITLNHADAIHATPRVTHQEADLPAPIAAQLARATPAADAPLPAPIAAAVTRAVGLDVAGRHVDWSADEAYVALPRPGGDAWVSVTRPGGHITAEVTDRGVVSWLNDLHKGRNSGPVWGWFIDIFAVACLVFTASGLLLLQVHARHRPSTWPLVLAGLVVPLILAHFFIH